MKKIVFIVLILLLATPIAQAQRPQKTKHNRELRRTMKGHARQAKRQRPTVHHVTAGEKIGFGVLLLGVVLITRLD